MSVYLFPGLLWVCILPGIGSGQTAKEILAKNIGARGGADQLQAIHSMTVSTVDEANWGGRGSSVLRIMRPDRMRFDYTWQANERAPLITIITAFDGKVAWWADQHKGLEVPNTVTGDQLQRLREQAKHQFEASFDDLQESGDKIELLGKETAEGKSCYKIRFTTPSGEIRYVYYDEESFLVLRNDLVVPLKNGKEKLVTTIIGDYRSEGGIIFPHTFKVESVLTSAFAAANGLPLPMIFFEGKKGFTNSIVNKIEINQELNESVFQVPGTSTVPPVH